MLITKRQIDKLNDYSFNDFPVTSLYLNTNPVQYQREAYMKNLKTLIRQGKEKIEENANLHDAKQSVLKDFDTISTYIEQIFAPPFKSLALFSSSKNDFFQFYALDEPVKDMVVINNLPYTKPLFAFLRMIKRYSAALIKKDKLRIFEVFGNNIQEEIDLFTQTKFSSRSNTYIFINEKKHYNRIETEYAKFLREASEEALDFVTKRGIDYFVIGGDKTTAKDFYTSMHSYLKDIFADYIAVDFESNQHAVMEAVKQVNESYITQTDSKLIRNIEEKIAKNGNACKGIENVLRALTQAAVNTLVVEDGYTMPGYLQKETGFLYATADNNLNDLINIDDVVNEAMDEAINQGADIKIIKNKNLMKDIDHIAAILRFTVPPAD